MKRQHFIHFIKIFQSSKAYFFDIEIHFQLLIEKIFDYYAQVKVLTQSDNIYTKKFETMNDYFVVANIKKKNINVLRSIKSMFMQF